MRKTVNNGRKAIFGLWRKMCSGKGVWGESSISPYQITSFDKPTSVLSLLLFRSKKMESLLLPSLSLSVWVCV